MAGELPHGDRHHCGIADSGQGTARTVVALRTGEPASTFQSCCVREIPPGFAPLFTLGTAVALHNAIERTTGLQVDIKWPNDLLVNGKKVCGILAEMQAEFDRVNSLIIGVGINVNHGGFPADIAETATSLRIAAGRNQSRIELFVECLEEFENLLMRFEKYGPCHDYRDVDQNLQLCQWPAPSNQRWFPCY